MEQKPLPSTELNKVSENPTFHTLQSALLTWHKASFPELRDDERPSRILGKVVEEVQEFFEATGLATVPYSKTVGNPDEEAVDVLFTLVAWLGFSGYDIDAEIERKLEKLAERKFEYRNGRYYRVGKVYESDERDASGH